MRSSVTEYVPQFLSGEEAARRRRRALFVWGGLSAFAVAVLGALVLAPVLRAGGWAGAAQGLYLAFHAVCHQIPERSFYVGEFPLAVCARCTGLYAGAAAGVLLYPLARALTRTDAPARWWLLAAALPTIVDLLLGVTGLWENTHLSRFLTALLAGAAAAFYVVPGAVELGGRGLGRVVGQLESREGGRGEVSRLT
jgi:uncharacterized membrane protein